jgi:carbon-monoxide dehydrogenase medium subunit
MRASGAERLLIGRAPSEALWTEAADAVRGSVEPEGDIHASAAYRKHASGVLAQRALREALTRIRKAA